MATNGSNAGVFATKPSPAHHANRPPRRRGLEEELEGNDGGTAEGSEGEEQQRSCPARDTRSPYQRIGLSPIRFVSPQLARQISQ